MKKIYLLYSLLFCFSTLSFAQKYEDLEEWGESVQISVVDIPSATSTSAKKTVYKYGLIDDKGKSVTGMEYDNMIFTDDGMAIVNKDGKRGMMDKSGKMVIGMSYDKMYPFAPEKLRVKKGDKWGVIDYKGKTVVPFAYNVISEPLGGVVKATKNKKFGLMNMSAKEISPFAYDYISLSSDGTTCIVKNGDLYSMLDPVSGKELLPFKYTNLSINGDYVISTIKEAGRETNGIIDKQGRECIPCIYKDVVPFKNNIVKVQNDQYRYGLMTCGGEELAPVIYDRIFAPRRGFFIAQSRVYGDCMLDSLGQKIASFPKEFQLMDIYDDGRALVESKGYKMLVDTSKILIKFPQDASVFYKNGFITSKDKNAAFANLYNIKGDTISVGEYESLSFLSDNLLIAMKGSKAGVIDTNNKVIIPFEYDRIDWITGNNHIRVVKDEKCGLIDLNNKVVIPFEYKAIYTLGDNRYKAEKDDGLSTILEKTGKVLVPAKYASVYPNGNFYEVTYARKSGIIDRKGKEIIAPQYNLIKDYSNGLFIVVNREE